MENIHHMWLMALLQELVREKGYKGAARVLEIDPQTVTDSAKTGRLTRPGAGLVGACVAGGRRLGGGAAAQAQRGARRSGRGLGPARSRAWRGEVESLGKEVRRRLSGIEGAVAALGRDDPQRTGAGHAGAGPQPEGSGAGAAPERRGAGRKPPSKPSMRREYPDLATRGSLPRTTRRYSGRRGPLIVEWRGLKDAHPNEGRGLDWLTAQERLLELELALLEEHGMTLPPEKQPLRGLDRSGQTSWRRTALYDTRRARRKAELVESQEVV